MPQLVPFEHPIEVEGRPFRSLICQAFAVAKVWWSSLEKFETDLGSATNARDQEMRDWAETHERSADAPGTGRNPRARRQFRRMRDAADAELDRRGLLWPESK